MTQAKKPIGVAIIGTASRVGAMYGPILKALPDDVELVSAWGRSTDSARRLGESLSASWYSAMDQLIRKTVPQIGVE